MKVIAKIFTLSLVTAAASFAQTNSQIGAWSVYTSAGNAAKDVVMLQTVSANQYRNANGEPVAAKLDVICKNHKVAAVVLETPSSVDTRKVEYNEAVPTTKVILAVEGRNSIAENWAVADGGHSLTPYSELSQGKLNHTWVERISSTPALALQVGGSEVDATRSPDFNTAGLSEALTSVGCTK